MIGQRGMSLSWNLLLFVVGLCSFVTFGVVAPVVAVDGDVDVVAAVVDDCQHELY